MSWAVEDHTADVRLRVEAADRAALFDEAARCFGEFVAGGARSEAPRVERAVEVDGADPAELWVRWWRALLRLWTVEGLLPVAARVEAGGGPLRVRAHVACLPAAELDASRCEDVKAVTWHGAEAGEAAGRWLGRIVLDV